MLARRLRTVSAALTHDILLFVGVGAGSLGLLSPSRSAERWPPYQARACSAHCWSVLVLSLTALALVAFDVLALWLAGAAHGPRQVVGLPLIERRVERLTAVEGARGG
jgi:hypothetical protein